MTLLHYAVAIRHMCASQSELDHPFILETLKLYAVESGVIVGKDLPWQPLFIKYWL